MFKFTEAQKYELAWQKQYIISTLGEEYKKWLIDRYWWENHLASWFKDPDEFISYTRNKIGIDVGCGSVPILRYQCGLGQRFVIDPLAEEYKKIQTQLWGGSFFDELTIIAKPAEEYISEFLMTVDGVIHFRNALDHAEDPLQILFNLSEYAASGCYLLLWTDLWHNETPDEGHKNITKSTGAMDALLRGLGWQFQNMIAPQREESVSLEYGGVWRKL